MTEEQIRQLIQDEVNKRMSETDTVNQFALSQTSFHTHNGVDSKKIPFIGLSDTPVSYYGSAGKSVIVNDDENGLIFSEAETTVTTYGSVTDSSLVPAGWTRTQVGNVVTYTHNLGHLNYSVVASFENNAASTIPAYVSVDNKTTTSFDIARYRFSDGAVVGGRQNWVLFDYNSYA